MKFNYLIFFKKLFYYKLLKRKIQIFETQIFLYLTQTQISSNPIKHELNSETK